MASAAIEQGLRDIAHSLQAHGQRFALVGGVAVSIRAEVRFTRDVDLALSMEDDRALEALVRDLRVEHYDVAAVVEHEAVKRLATVRLRSPSGVVVDLLAASSGIEPEIVARAGPVDIPGVGVIPVARAEELLAMKVLSITDVRLQDRIDAINLVVFNEKMDMEVVRSNLDLITARGFHRQQDLRAKLTDIVMAVAKQSAP